MYKLSRYSLYAALFFFTFSCYWGVKVRSVTREIQKNQRVAIQRNFDTLYSQTKLALEVELDECMELARGVREDMAFPSAKILSITPQDQMTQLPDHIAERTMENMVGVDQPQWIGTIQNTYSGTFTNFLWVPSDATSRKALVIAFQIDAFSQLAQALDFGPANQLSLISQDVHLKRSRLNQLFKRGMKSLSLQGPGASTQISNHGDGYLLQKISQSQDFLILYISHLNLQQSAEALQKLYVFLSVNIYFTLLFALYFSLTYRKGSRQVYWVFSTLFTTLTTLLILFFFLVLPIDEYSGISPDEQGWVTEEIQRDQVIPVLTSVHIKTIKLLERTKVYLSGCIIQQIPPGERIPDEAPFIIQGQIPTEKSQLNLSRAIEQKEHTTLIWDFTTTIKRPPQEEYTALNKVSIPFSIEAKNGRLAKPRLLKPHVLSMKARDELRILTQEENHVTTEWFVTQRYYKYSQHLSKKPPQTLTYIVVMRSSFFGSFYVHMLKFLLIAILFYTLLYLKWENSYSGYMRFLHPILSLAILLTFTVNQPLESFVTPAAYLLHATTLILYCMLILTAAASHIHFVTKRKVLFFSQDQTFSKLIFWPLYSFLFLLTLLYLILVGPA